MQKKFDASRIPEPLDPVLCIYREFSVYVLPREGGRVSILVFGWVGTL